ncbi:MAG: helix-turn-helix domain-containing protein [Candidatus Binatia bacterium]
MRVHCRLYEIMRERGVKVEGLSTQSGVDRGAISALRTGKWDRVSRSAMGKICGALNISLDELFALIPEDIWAPIKLGHEVTLHYGSRSIPDARRPNGDGADTMWSGQYVGVWDMRALNCIWEHLRQSGCDVSVRLREHVTGLERSSTPLAQESLRQVFDSGNHVVLGSPTANQFTEEVVCKAFGVTPYAPQQRDAFPFGFVWDPRRAVRSSFGWEGMGDEFGIASIRTGKLIACSTSAREGEGQDCALVLVHRMLQPPARRQYGSDVERVIIAILGYRGAGTFAAAQLATDPKHADGLYPAQRNAARLRVVRVTYTDPGGLQQDSRQVTGAYLVDDRPREPSAPKAPRGGRRLRRKKSAAASLGKRPKPHRARRPRPHAPRASGTPAQAERGERRTQTQDLDAK